MATTAEAVKADAREKKIRAGKGELLKAIPKAIETLVELLESSDDRVRLQAANSIVDRTLGKPSPTLDEAAPEALEEAVGVMMKAFAQISQRGDRALPAPALMEEPTNLVEKDGVTVIDGNFTELPDGQPTDGVS